MTYDPFNPFTTMHDYHLKFADQAQAESVLFEGEDRRAKYDAVDVIGAIYKPTGEMLLGEDGEYPEMEPVTGFHVNVRHSGDAPELSKYIINVATPERVWL